MQMRIDIMIPQQTLQNKHGAVGNFMAQKITWNSSN